MKLGGCVLNLVSLASNIMTLHHSYVCRGYYTKIRWNQRSSIEIFIWISYSRWIMYHGMILILALLLGFDLSVTLFPLSSSWMNPLRINQTCLGIWVRDPQWFEICRLNSLTKSLSILLLLLASNWELRSILRRILIDFNRVSKIVLLIDDNLALGQLTVI